MSDIPRAFAVWFSDMFRWDPASFHGIQWCWPDRFMVPIGSVLRLRKEKVDRENYPFGQLQPITIHFDGSIERRQIKPGRQYSMDLFFARAGDVVVAKIDLKNGAVGLVPEWRNVVVTGHFAVYEPDRSKLLPEFLLEIIQTDFFKSFLWRNKVGAEGRKEVKLDFFESVNIPLPSLETQHVILAEWRKAKDAIAAAEERVHRMEQSIPGLIYDMLGTPAAADEGPRSRVMTVRWSELERWSFRYVAQKRAGLLGFTRTRYPIARLADHIVDTMNGYCIKPVGRQTPYRMLKLSALKPGGLDLTEGKFIHVSPAIAARYCLHKDDVLICRSNAYEYVAKSSTVLSDQNAYLFPDIMIRVLLKPSVLPPYVVEVINTPLGRSFFQANSRRAVGGMWKIGADDIANFPIPVPPLADQQRIVERVQAVRERIAREREAARLAEQRARADLEGWLLGVKPVPS